MEVNKEKTVCGGVWGCEREIKKERVREKWSCFLDRLIGIRSLCNFNCFIISGILVYSDCIISVRQTES